MKKQDWTIGQEGVRPAGKPDECFYCRNKSGEQHKADCVIRKRTVVVKMTMEYVIAVPEDWDVSNIEFHRNESSWCANNAREELTKMFEYIEKSREEVVNPDGTTSHGNDVPCLCDRTQFEYVREATPEDEYANGVFVEKEPS